MTKVKAKTQFMVGGLYTTDGTDVWIVSKFVAEPQVFMQCIGTDDKREGLVSQFADFVRLIPETDPPARPKRKYERKQAWPDIPDGEGIKEQANDSAS